VAAIAFAAFTVLVTAWQLVHARTIEVGQGCGWDGVSYCAMTRGEAVMEPYSRRVLLPWLARLFSANEPVASFRILNAIGLVGLLAAVLLLLRVVTPSKVPPALMVLTGSLVLLDPWTVRLYLTYPVLTDIASAALVIAWCAATLRRTQLTDILGFGLLVCLGLTREQWPVVAVAAAWLAVLLGLRTWRWATASTAVSLAVLIFVFTRPTSLASAPLTSVLLLWVRESLASPENFIRLIFMVVTGVGLVSFLPFLRFHVVRQDRRLLWLCAVALGNLAGSLFAGGDTDRILMPTGLILLVVSAALVIREPGIALSWVLLAMATVMTWHPWTVVGPDGASWLRFYGLRIEPIDLVMKRILSDASTVAIPIVIAVLYALPSRVLLTHKPDRQDPLDT
jgi:hypothetical protein